jgi:predicted kinase
MTTSEQAAPAVGRGLYSRAMSRRTYGSLRLAAARWLRRGQSVVLDATYGQPAERTAIRKVARRVGARLEMVVCRADDRVLQARLAARTTDSTTTSDARLELWPALKAAFVEPLDVPDAIAVDTAQPVPLVVEQVMDALPCTSERVRSTPVRSAVPARVGQASPLAPDTAGLSEADARRRLQEDGPNELPRREDRGLLHTVTSVLREPMILLLISAGGVYLFLGDREEAILLLGSIVLIVGIEMYQERRTEHALDALRDLSSPRALVIRDGASPHPGPRGRARRPSGAGRRRPRACRRRAPVVHQPGRRRITPDGRIRSRPQGSRLGHGGCGATRR